MSEEKNSKKEEFMLAVTAMNKYLKENKKDEIVLDGDKTAQFQALLAPIVVEIESGNAENLPVEVIEFYNENFATDEPDEPEKAPKEEKPKKEKKTKEKKEKKPKKVIEKDAYGVSLNCGAHKINMMLEKGASIKDMIDEVGTTRSRVQSHMASLKKKGFFIDNIDGVFTIVSEAPPERPKKEKPKKEKKEKKKKEKPAKSEEKTEEKTEAKSESPAKTEKKTSSKKKSDKKGK